MLDQLDYDPGRCEHFTHFDEAAHTVAAISDCHNGKFIRGFLSTSDMSFGVASFHNNSDDFAKAGDSGVPVLVASSRPQQPLKSNSAGEDFHSDQVFVASAARLTNGPVLLR